MKNEIQQFKNHQKIFEDIYAKNTWHGGGSGYGSEISYSVPFIVFMAYWITNNKIKSIVDLGCGDLQWMPYLYKYLPTIDYTGIDVVGDVIKNHRINYPDQKFIECDLTEIDWDKIPNSDLYFIKDVLQHWPNSSISPWLDNFFNKKNNSSLIIVNCDLENIRQLPQWKDHSPDRTMEIGGFKPLSKNHSPLSNYNIDEIFSHDTKKVYLVKGTKNK